MTEYPYGTTAAPPVTGQPATGNTPYFGSAEPFGSTSSTPDAGSTGSGSDSSMSEKASNAAGAGKQAASDIAGTAGEKAKDVVEETKKQARDLVGEARSQLTSQAGDQHRNLVSNLHALADQLSGMADSSESGGIATDLVSQAGDRAHTAASWLEQRQPGDLLGEVRSFARQRPGTFLLGAALAGVVVGRLTRGAVAAHTDSGSTAGSNGSGLTAADTSAYGTSSPYDTPSYGGPTAPATTVLPTTGAGIDPTPGLAEGTYSTPPAGYGVGDGYGTGGAGYGSGNGGVAP